MRSAGSLVRISRVKRCLSGSPVSGQANLFPEPSSVTVKSEKTLMSRENVFKPLTNDELYILLDKFYRDVAGRQSTVDATNDTMLEEEQMAFDVQGLFREDNYFVSVKNFDYGMKSVFTLRQKTIEMPKLMKEAMFGEMTPTNFRTQKDWLSPLPMWRYEAQNSEFQNREDFEARIGEILRKWPRFVNDLDSYTSYPKNTSLKFKGEGFHKEWLDWWSKLLRDIVHAPFNREAGLPEYDLIKDRAVVWKLYDHSVDGQKLEKLSGHTIMPSIITDIFEKSVPNNMFMDSYLGLWDTINYKNNSVLSLTNTTSYGMVYRTYDLSSVAFHPRNLDLDRQATFIVVYETPEAAQLAIEQNHGGDFAEHLPQFINSQATLRSEKDFFHQTADKGATRDGPHFQPGATKMSVRLLSEKDWNRHLCRRDWLRFAHSKKDGLSSVTVEFMEYDNSGKVDWDNIDLDREPRRDVLTFDLNERLAIDQDMLSVSITKDLLKVVAEILVANNDLCVLGEKDNNMEEINFMEIMNDLVKMWMNFDAQNRNTRSKDDSVRKTFNKSR